MSSESSFENDLTDVNFIFIRFFNSKRNVIRYIYIYN